MNYDFKVGNALSSTIKLVLLPNISVLYQSTFTAHVVFQLFYELGLSDKKMYPMGIGPSGNIPPLVKLAFKLRF